MPESRGHSTEPSFEDRSVRLTLFGSIAVIVGAACGLLGALHFVFLLLASRLAQQGIQADARSYVTGGIAYLLLGAAFVAVGVGSIRKRRWARPLMLTLAWTWLLGGAATVLLLPGLLELAMTSLAPASDELSVMMAGIRAVMLGLGALLGVVLPGVFIVVYRDSNLRQTCEASDPGPDWTERCPPSVLGLSLGLGACAVIGFMTALRPAVPVFGRVVTGWPGALTLIVGGAVLLWLAREVYELRSAGWWVTTVLLTVLGISTWITLQRADPAELFHAMGYPDDGTLAGGGAFITVASWLTLVVTVLTVVYMLGIRKHFGHGASQEA